MAKLAIPQVPRVADVRSLDVALNSNRAAWEQLRSPRPWLDGMLVEFVADGSAAQVVEHGLGRVATGVWCLGVQQAAGTATGAELPVYRENDLSDGRSISVYFERAGTYQLWIW